jgi:pimeloyl-ACP methyl ester carboxylesterase
MMTVSRIILLTFLFLLTHHAAASGQWADWPFQEVPVAYRVDGDGPPVVQIHGIGAGASSEQTKYQIDALTVAGYRVYSLDLTGWGRPIGPRTLFTGEYYSDLLSAFLTDVVGTPSARIGHSLGATYAIAAAASNPGQVTALVLNATVGAESFTTESDAASEARWNRFVSGIGGKFWYRALGSWISLTAFSRTSLYVDPSFCDLPISMTTASTPEIRTPSMVQPHFSLETSDSMCAKRLLP